MSNDKEQIKETIRALKEDMGHALLYPPDATTEDMLRAQAAALDAAFRLLLAEAPGRWSETAFYGAALKAQNQFRHTALALNSLKEKENNDKKK